MPLLDWDAVTRTRRRTWQGFHSAWATCITFQLNAQPLPRRYHAEPTTHAGMHVESDILTIEEDLAELTNGSNGQEGGVATAVYAPPQPPLVAQVDFGGLDVYEVRVYDDEASQALAAVLELVSPANKDRPASREAFATKCAAYLQQGVAVAVIDIVTERRENLHEALMDRLGLGEEQAAAVQTDLYAVSYRTAGVGTKLRLEAWPFALAVGAPLPTLPLWLSPVLAVPVHLEASYAAACAGLLLPTA